jgi:hypothetical protein
MARGFAGRGRHWRECRSQGVNAPFFFLSLLTCQTIGPGSMREAKLQKLCCCISLKQPTFIWSKGGDGAGYGRYPVTSAS